MQGMCALTQLVLFFWWGCYVISSDTPTCVSRSVWLLQSRWTLITVSYKQVPSPFYPQVSFISDPTTTLPAILGHCLCYFKFIFQYGSSSHLNQHFCFAFSLLVDVDKIQFWVEQLFSDTPLKLLSSQNGVLLLLCLANRKAANRFVFLTYRAAVLWLYVMSQRVYFVTSKKEWWKNAPRKTSDSEERYINTDTLL